MRNLRPYAGTAAIVWVLFRDIGLAAGFFAVLFFAGSNQGDFAVQTAALLVAVAGVVVCSRSVYRCLPITLSSDGRFHGIVGSLRVSECSRVVVLHDHRSRYNTVLEAKHKKVWISSHLCTASDLEQAVELAKCIGINAYLEVRGGKFSNLSTRSAARKVRLTPL